MVPRLCKYVLQLAGPAIFSWCLNNRGHHVLPLQEVRPALLLADRREPLGRRSVPPAGHRHPGTLGSAPTRWPARCLALVRCPLLPDGTPTLGPRPWATADHHHPAPWTDPPVRAPLARDRLPTCPRGTAGRTQIRVSRGAGYLPDRLASPVRPRQ